MASSRATKKLSRCFAIYRPSDISRKGLLFFLAAKITSSAGFKKNVVYLAKMIGEIDDFVCSPYFDHFAHPPPPKGRQAFENRLGKFERDLTLLKWMLGFETGIDGRGRGRVAPGSCN
jgi:hypothetical protein